MLQHHVQFAKSIKQMVKIWEWIRTRTACSDVALYMHSSLHIDKEQCH